MAGWLITQGNRQYNAANLAELQKLAGEGKLGPGDMVQPPGATDWLYALEIPELKAALAKGEAFREQPKQGVTVPIPIVLLLGVLGLGAGYFVFDFATRMPEAEDLNLLGERGLKLTEMLVTAPAGAPVRSAPEETASATATAAKDSKVQLLAKRGPWYQIGTAEGAQGWVKVDEVVAAYFYADSKTRQDYDPIYNPDRYVEVKGSSWMQVPDPKRKNLTIFQFLLENTSKFEMTDIKLLATIKDTQDRVLETKEIAIEGQIPPNGGSFVGTLQPDPKDKEGMPRLMTETYLNQLAQTDPDVALRWSAGVEVEMGVTGFEEANIDLLQIRAVPKELGK